MDLDPIVEAQSAEPIFEAAAAPIAFEIEDVIDDVEPVDEASAFDLTDFLPAREPISLHGGAPLALRDEADAERPGEMNELHEWLSRIRDRQTDSVSEYMAG